MLIGRVLSQLRQMDFLIAASRVRQRDYPSAAAMRSIESKRKKRHGTSFPPSVFLFLFATHQRPTYQRCAQSERIADVSTWQFCAFYKAYFFFQFAFAFFYNLYVIKYAVIRPYGNYYFIESKLYLMLVSVFCILQ